MPKKKKEVFENTLQIDPVKLEELQRVTGAFSKNSTRSSVSSEKSGSSNDVAESPKSERSDVFLENDGANEEHQDNNNDPTKKANLKKSMRKKSSRSKSFGGVTDMLNGAISKIDDSRNRHFHKLFKQIPQDEYAITSYTCALLKGTMLLQGRIYVSRNWLCFHSNIFGKETQVIIPVLTIKSITRERTALVVPNAIGVRTMDDKKHVFGSLLSRPVTYKTLVTIWQSVLRDYAEEDISISQDSSARDDEEDELVLESDTDSTQVEHASPVRQKELAEAAENAAKAVNDDFSSNEGEDDDLIGPLPLIDKPIPEVILHSDAPDAVDSATGFASRKASIASYLNHAYKTVLSVAHFIQKIPHTHIFILLSSILAIFLLASSVVLSYRIFQLQPVLETNSDTLWTPQYHDSYINQAYGDSYLLNHRVHTATVEKIHATLAANLAALSQVHSSLETLKQQAVEKNLNDDDEKLSQHYEETHSEH